MIVTLLAVILATFCTAPLAAQAKKAEQELVSISPSTHINDAIQILETFSWKYNRKKMINLSSYNGTIGVPINNLDWQQALELIALKTGLVVNEQAGFISLQEVSQAEQVLKDVPPPIDIHSKQVRIKSIVMLADKAYLRSLGIDWSTLLNGKVVLDVGFLGASQVSGDGLNAALTRTTTFNGQPIEVNTLLRTIESNQKGTIIAQPNIVVTSGKKGYIQVGQDVSVKSVDDAGNTTDNFFATGVILDVLPTVYMSGDKPVVHLVASVERSAASPGAISTVINKSTSSTELILYDGEETAIGGLYDTDELKVRGGIPILKDLPWWVFGIRYLAGYDTYDRKERELIIILKVEVIDSVLERLNQAGVTE